MATPDPGSQGVPHDTNKISARDTAEEIIQKGRMIWPKGKIDLENATAVDVNDFILYKGNVYSLYGFTDEELWDSFQKDFANFTIEVFEAADAAGARQLRLHLRSAGVWVYTKRNKSLAESLLSTIQVDTNSCGYPSKSAIGT